MKSKALTPPRLSATVAVASNWLTVYLFRSINYSIDCVDDTFYKNNLISFLQINKSSDTTQLGQLGVTQVLLNSTICNKLCGELSWLSRREEKKEKFQEENFLHQLFSSEFWFLFIQGSLIQSAYWRWTWRRRSLSQLFVFFWHRMILFRVSDNNEQRLGWNGKDYQVRQWPSINLHPTNFEPYQ